MSAIVRPEGAQVYQFQRKLGGHPLASPHPVNPVVVTLRPRAGIAVESGSGWYHEAALRETDPARKH